MGFPAELWALMMFAAYVAVIGFALRMLWRMVIALESIARSQSASVRIAEEQLVRAQPRHDGLPGRTYP